MVAQDQRCIQYSNMAKCTAGRPLGPTPQVTPLSWMNGWLVGWLDTFVAWSRMFTVLVAGLGHEMYCGKRRSIVSKRTGLVGSPAHSSPSQARHWLLPDTYAVATSESADISRTFSVSEYPNLNFHYFGAFVSREVPIKIVTSIRLCAWNSSRGWFPVNFILI